jgi:hypothetical protein
MANVNDNFELNTAQAEAYFGLGGTWHITNVVIHDPPLLMLG